MYMCTVCDCRFGKRVVCICINSMHVILSLCTVSIVNTGLCFMYSAHAVQLYVQYSIVYSTCKCAYIHVHECFKVLRAFTCAYMYTMYIHVHVCS